jgi:hypothetical protein
MHDNLEILKIITIFAVLIEISVKNKPFKFHSGEIGTPILTNQIPKLNALRAKD